MQATPRCGREIMRDIRSLLAGTTLPGVAGVELAGASTPAGEVGGDYLDVRVGESGRLFICVADVMGKGLRAALFALGLRSALRAALYCGEEHEHVFRVLNRVVGEDLRAVGAYATLCLLSLDPGTMSATFSNAGHCPPLVYSKGRATSISDAGRALGLSHDGGHAVPQARTVPLEAGDVVVLYTDGLVDVRNRLGESFGRQRLRQALEELAPFCAADIRDGVAHRVAAFIGRRRQCDDMTLAVLKIKGGGAEIADTREAGR